MLKKWPVLIGLVAVVAAAGTIVVVATSSRSSVRFLSSTTDAPVNTALPTITGYTTPKSELYATNGTWSGSPTTYSYRWQDCNSSGTSCTHATGAASGSCSPTASCYVVTSGEASSGDKITVKITATNSHGSSRPATVPHARPASTSEPVACALSHAAGYDGTNSCWATHTGVTGATGFTEAQILAGQSTLRHVTGDVTITTPNTVIDHEWISGCVAIDPGANNVTIRDSLITPHGDTCSGGGGGSESSAVNNGQSSSSPTGLLIEDTTVDGGNVGGYGVSIVHGSCIRCNIFGFVDNFFSGRNSAAAPSLFQDSYSHDMATGLAGGHEQALNFMGASYVTIEHSYAIADAGNGYTTGALNLQDWAGSGPTHITADGNYLDGVRGVDLIGSCTSTYNHISNNAFSSDNGYGGTDYFSYFATPPYRSTAVGNTWTGNYVAESPSGAAPPPKGNPGTGGC